MEITTPKVSDTSSSSLHLESEHQGSSWDDIIQSCSGDDFCNEPSSDHSEQDSEQDSEPISNKKSNPKPKVEKPEKKLNLNAAKSIQVVFPIVSATLQKYLDQEGNASYSKLIYKVLALINGALADLKAFMDTPRNFYVLTESMLKSLFVVLNTVITTPKFFSMETVIRKDKDGNTYLMSVFIKKMKNQDGGFYILGSLYLKCEIIGNDLVATNTWGMNCINVLGATYNSYSFHYNGEKSIIGSINGEFLREYFNSFIYLGEDWVKKNSSEGKSNDRSYGWRIEPLVQLYESSGFQICKEWNFGVKPKESSTKFKSSSRGRGASKGSRGGRGGRGRGSN